MIFDSSINNGFLLPVDPFVTLLRNNDDLDTIQNIPLPKEFVFGSNSDQVIVAKPSDMFHRYKKYATDYVLDQNYQEAYVNSLFPVEEYGKQYFETADLKPVGEWAAKEKKDVLLSYIQYAKYFKMKSDFVKKVVDSYQVYCRNYLTYYYQYFKNSLFRDLTFEFTQRRNIDQLGFALIFIGFNFGEQQLPLLKKSTLSLFTNYGYDYSDMIAERKQSNEYQGYHFLLFF